MPYSSQSSCKAPAPQKAAQKRQKEATSPFGEHCLCVQSFPNVLEHAHRTRVGFSPSQICYWRRHFLGSLRGFWFSSPPPCSCRIAQRRKSHKSAVTARRWKHKYVVREVIDTEGQILPWQAPCKLPFVRREKDGCTSRQKSDLGTQARMTAGVGAWGSEGKILQAHLLPTVWNRVLADTHYLTTSNPTPTSWIPATHAPAELEQDGGALQRGWQG